MVCSLPLLPRFPPFFSWLLTGCGRAGPTATGKAPFMAQTRTFEGTYVPNTPLQTAVPVVGGGDEGRKSIFEMMG